MLLSVRRCGFDLLRHSLQAVANRSEAVLFLQPSSTGGHSLLSDCLQSAPLRNRAVVSSEIPKRTQLLQCVRICRITHNCGKPMCCRDNLLDGLYQPIAACEIKVSIAADQILANLDVHVLRERALLLLREGCCIVVDQSHEAAEHQVFEFAVESDDGQ